MQQVKSPAYFDETYRITHTDVEQLATLKRNVVFESFLEKQLINLPTKKFIKFQVDLE